MVLQVYTDASFSWEKDIAACGFVILKNKQIIKHQVVLLEKIKTIYHAEFWSIYNALCNAYLIKGVETVCIYSDSIQALSVCNERLSKSHRSAKTRKSKWGKVDLFEDFWDLLAMFKEEKIRIQFYKVKAHSNNQFNNMVDRSCLKHLREHLKSHHS